MNDNLERLIEKELKLTGEYLKCEVATLVVLSQDGYNPLFYHLNQLPSRVNRYVDATFERNRGVVEEIKEDYLLGLIKLLGQINNKDIRKPRYSNISQALFDISNEFEEKLDHYKRVKNGGIII
ncbi:MAG: hypothetical protein AABY07_09770 [Nanoarchaeota archaeon]